MFFFYTCLVQLQWIRHKFSLNQKKKKADFLPDFSVPVLVVHSHLDIQQEILFKMILTNSFDHKQLLTFAKKKKKNVAKQGPFLQIFVY